ncbi:MAG: hypothetical protein F4Z00_12475 [Acidimicrobiaceae bacterium]|nr:hypothetical protein [Acidimicrobiaceae bacterium]MXZ66342.1 hypothetical protein [Acidimicrobiaceae bacterium]MYF35156.1 hypothetical protein [Acidimicrobiaceae bacterium]MYG77445.1 hypothetical protein [Acidimicrobiaceae bacterium]MYJ84182.1 hypothetical protein [Acidimicrobiaceae bacterium]
MDRRGPGRLRRASCPHRRLCVRRWRARRRRSPRHRRPCPRPSGRAAASRTARRLRRRRGPAATASPLARRRAPSRRGARRLWGTRR